MQRESSFLVRTMGLKIMNSRESKRKGGIDFTIATSARGWHERYRPGAPPAGSEEEIIRLSERLRSNRKYAGR
jgi:hypothetical protein